MAGTHLHVGHGVAGGGVVGERGVAQVVERAKGAADSGVCEGGAEVLAREFGGVEWCAFVGVAEDEFVGLGIVLVASGWRGGRGCGGRFRSSVSRRVILGW